jgi:hypothetical protein
LNLEPLNLELIRPHFAINDGSHRDKLGNATVNARAMNVSHR